MNPRRFRALLVCCAAMAYFPSLPALADKDESAVCVKLDKSFAKNMQKIVGETYKDMPPTFPLSYTFFAIWMNADMFEKDAEAFLESGVGTEQEQLRAVYAMKHLHLPQLLDFYEKVLALRRAGKINQRIFIDAIVPQEYWDTQLLERYKNPRVRKFIREVQKSGLDPQQDGYYDRLLAGAGLIEYKDSVSGGRVDDYGYRRLSNEEYRKILKSHGVYLGLICGD